MGWFSNWLYANKEPTDPWRCGQSIPRVLKLKKIGNSIRLAQEPIAELASLRGEHLHIGPAGVVEANLRLRGFHSDTYELSAEIDTASEAGFKLRKGAPEETLAGYNANSAEVFIDRTRSGIVDFSGDFPGRHAGPVVAANHRIRLCIFVDRSSVELFANDGGTVISDRIFPSPTSNGLEIYALGGSARVISLDVWKLKSTW